jgi:hypothetical protein
LVEKDGKLDIHILGEDGAPRFEGNTPVTITSLLEPVFKPYLKANNDSQQKDEPQQRSFKVENGGANGSRRGANVEVQV